MDSYDVPENVMIIRAGARDGMDPCEYCGDTCFAESDLQGNRYCQMCGRPLEEI